MFGRLHVISLCVSLVFIVIAALLTLRLPFEKVARLMLVIGLIAELVKLFAYTLMNEEHGWAVYIAHYMCTCLLAVTLVCIGPIIRAIKGCKARAKA